MGFIKFWPVSGPMDIENRCKLLYYNHLHRLCRNEATRTPDPYVPNVVRYQLRYIPIQFSFNVVPPGVEPGTQGFSVLCSTS